MASYVWNLGNPEASADITARATAVKVSNPEAQDWTLNGNASVGSTVTIETGKTVVYNGTSQVDTVTVNNAVAGAKVTVNGGSNDDVITITAGATTVNGGTGKDTIDYAATATTGQKLIYDASDVITTNAAALFTLDNSASSTAVNWDLTKATWALAGIATDAASTAVIANIEAVVGSSAADTITGVAGTTIDGGAGADTLSSAGTIVYDAADAKVAGNGATVLTAAAQTDGITLFMDGNSVFSGFANVIGGAGADNLRGAAGVATLDGGKGDDLLWAGSSTAANQTLTGGAGNDQFWYGADEGAKFITYDTVTGGTSASSGDTVHLYNVSAFDLIGVSGGAFKLTTNGTDGTISLGGTNALTMLGAGTNGSNAAHHFTSSEGWAFDITFGGAGGSLAGTANVIDNLVGGTAPTTFDGKGGGDNLFGSATAGDTYKYYAGDKIYLQAAGADNLTVANATAGMQVYMDSIVSSSGVVPAATSWNITGSAFADELRGQTGVGAETLNGGAGNDQLWGGAGIAGADTLVGGAGADTYYYGLDEGADVVAAGSVSSTGNAADTVNFYNVTGVAALSGVLSGNDMQISVTGTQGVGTLTLQGWNTADGINKLTNVVVSGTAYTLGVDSDNKATFTAK